MIAPKVLRGSWYFLKWAFNQDKPVAIRYPRGGDVISKLKPIEKVEFSKWEVLEEGKDCKCAIIATGKMSQHAILANELLNKEGIYPKLINATFIKPLDEGMLKELSKKDMI